MNKTKSTIEIAKECYILTAHGWLFCKEIDLDNFRKACEADFVSQCKQVATIQSNGDSLYAFIKPSCVIELGTPIFTMPNDGE